MTRRDDLYATARRALERGDAASWEAAEAMAELVDRGETQRQIAAQLGCSHITVGRYVAIWRGSLGTKKRPQFSEAMAEVRGDRTNEAIPKTPERRAELVAELLKDKEVADAPAVRKVQERHADRRIRAEAAAFREEHDIPTRTETERDNRRQSPLSNDFFWHGLLGELQRLRTKMAEAAGEIDRTGLPRSGSGEIIRTARALRRDLEQFEQRAGEAGIGRAM